jgi:hypothetical protein
VYLAIGWLSLSPWRRKGRYEWYCWHLSVGKKMVGCYKVATYRCPQMRKGVRFCQRPWKSSKVGGLANYSRKFPAEEYSTRQLSRRPRADSVVELQKSRSAIEIPFHYTDCWSLAPAEMCMTTHASRDRPSIVTIIHRVHTHYVIRSHKLLLLNITSACGTYHSRSVHSSLLLQYIASNLRDRASANDAQMIEFYMMWTD